MSVVITIVPIVIGTIATFMPPSSIETKATENVRQQPTLSLPTIVRNESLLQQALKNMGAGKIFNGDQAASVMTEIDDQLIQFVREKDEYFTIQFYGKISTADADTFISELEEEYGNVVQNHVYETLKRKAEANNMALLNETVQDDQTIVLTYNLK